MLSRYPFSDKYGKVCAGRGKETHGDGARTHRRSHARQRTDGSRYERRGKVRDKTRNEGAQVRRRSHARQRTDGSRYERRGKVRNKVRNENARARHTAKTVGKRGGGQGHSPSPSIALLFSTACSARSLVALRDFLLLCQIPRYSACFLACTAERIRTYKVSTKTATNMTTMASP